MQRQISARPHFGALCSMGKPCSSYELFWYAMQEAEDVRYFFHTDVTLADGSTLLGGEWPGVAWYPDMADTSAALQDLSWFIRIHQV